jgi:sugar/nucleoside kinase (ribokinase family)
MKMKQIPANDNKKPSQCKHMHYNLKENIVWGTGLICLDVVVNDPYMKAPYLWAGGTCGNVLTILSFLGWLSYPIARLGSDHASRDIVKDMSRYGVKLSNIIFDDKTQTPIILEKISTTAEGTPIHRFSLICPNCGSWFPRYSPIPLQKVKLIEDKLPKPKYYFFDRISAASLHLAHKAHELGATVVFEPPSIKCDSSFRKAIAVCDILKYSSKLRSDISEMTYNSPPTLVVETLGSEGLKYRIRKNTTCTQWKLLSSFCVDDFIDASGSGDWCTSGLLYSLSY